MKKAMYVTNLGQLQLRQKNEVNKMKLNRKRMCAGVLAVVLTLTGCVEKGGGKTEPVNPIDISSTHELKNALHKVTVNDSERAFVVDQKSEYKIIAGSDDMTQKAAYYLV